MLVEGTLPRTRCLDSVACLSSTAPHFASGLQVAVWCLCAHVAFARALHHLACLLCSRDLMMKDETLFNRQPHARCAPTPFTTHFRIIQQRRDATDLARTYAWCHFRCCQPPLPWYPYLRFAPLACFLPTHAPAFWALGAPHGQHLPPPPASWAGTRLGKFSHAKFAVARLLRLKHTLQPTLDRRAAAGYETAFRAAHAARAARAAADWRAACGGAAVFRQFKQ